MEDVAAGLSALGKDPGKLIHRVQSRLGQKRKRTHADEDEDVEDDDEEAKHADQEVDADEKEHGDEEDVNADSTSTGSAAEKHGSVHKQLMAVIRRKQAYRAKRPRTATDTTPAASGTGRELVPVGEGRHQLIRVTQETDRRLLGMSSAEVCWHLCTVLSVNADSSVRIYLCVYV